jgi:hypothetical protein
VTDGKPSPAEWDPEVALTLMFQTGDHWFRLVADLEVGPFEGAEAELLKMAESLAPY